MINVQNAKKRSEILENELLKIDSELFELEKKYGEFNVKKATLAQNHQSKEDQNQASKTSPRRNSDNKVVEESSKEEESPLDQTAQATWRAAPPIENSQFTIPSYDNEAQGTELVQDYEKEEEIPRRHKSEVRKDIQDLESRIEDLEKLQEEAAEAEDYEKAEEIQNEIDEIQ